MNENIGIGNTTNPGRESLKAFYRQGKIDGCKELLKIMWRWQEICADRADRYMPDVTNFALWYGRSLAIEQIIKHLTREDREKK